MRRFAVCYSGSIRYLSESVGQPLWLLRRHLPDKRGDHLAVRSTDILSVTQSQRGTPRGESRLGFSETGYFYNPKGPHGSFRVDLSDGVYVN